MNGIHDMGGMHGLPPIEYDPNEPPFAQEWYGRVFALNRALELKPRVWLTTCSLDAPSALPNYRARGLYDKYTPHSGFLRYVVMNPAAPG